MACEQGYGSPFLGWMRICKWDPYDLCHLHASSQGHQKHGCWVWPEGAQRWAKHIELSTGTPQF
jgi:hypothetical protein